MLSHCFFSCRGDYAKTRLKMGPAVSMFLQMKCVHMQTFPKQTFINVLLSVQTAGFLSQIISTRCLCISLWHGFPVWNSLGELCWNVVSRKNLKCTNSKKEFKWIHHSCFFVFDSCVFSFIIARISSVPDRDLGCAGNNTPSLWGTTVFCPCWCKWKEESPHDGFYIQPAVLKLKRSLQHFQMCPFRRG